MENMPVGSNTGLGADLDLGADASAAAYAEGRGNVRTIDASSFMAAPAATPVAQPATRSAAPAVAPGLGTPNTQAVGATPSFRTTQSPGASSRSNFDADAGTYGVYADPYGVDSYPNPAGARSTVGSNRQTSVAPPGYDGPAAAPAFHRPPRYMDRGAQTWGSTAQREGSAYAATAGYVPRGPGDAPDLTPPRPMTGFRSRIPKSKS